MIIGFSVNNMSKIKDVSSCQYKPKILECQAKIVYNMELQDTFWS